MMKNDILENNLFYTCSLIEYIARLTKNEKKDIINYLGKDNIKKIYDLADIYHSDNIKRVANDFIELCNIESSNYDIIKRCKYNVPSYYDIGKVYTRLIIMVDNNSNNYIDTLIKIMSSWIIKDIDNYNSSMYYENPSYIYCCYKEGKIL